MSSMSLQVCSAISEPLRPRQKYFEALTFSQDLDPRRTSRQSVTSCASRQSVQIAGDDGQTVTWPKIGLRWFEYVFDCFCFTS